MPNVKIRATPRLYPTQRLSQPEHDVKTILCPILLFSLFSIALADDAEPERCADMENYRLLDFWVGDWEVYAGEDKVGDNRIEKVLGGCAVMEHWTGADGGEGKSLFYVDTNGTWKQVWVTEWAANPGGVKEKVRVPVSANGAVRFQGQVRRPDSGIYLDRTTLTALENGAVRQLIETSTDSGASWETAFDAIYVRAAAP